MKTKLILLTLTLATLSAPGLRADLLNIDISGEIRLGRRPPPPPEVVVVVPDDGPRGPAPWERGRWYQHNRGYYYYPGADAYYRPDDHLWFYVERGQWRSARNLPDWVRVDFNRSITLSMATDRPYLFHQQVVTRYPGNYFETRVRLKSEPRRDGDDRGRDRGKDDRRRDNDDRKDDHRDDRDKRP